MEVAISGKVRSSVVYVARWWITLAVSKLIIFILNLAKKFLIKTNKA